MKKFKKIISIGLAAIMAFSVMSVGVSAEELSTIEPTVAVKRIDDFELDKNQFIDNTTQASDFDIIEHPEVTVIAIDSTKGTDEIEKLAIVEEIQPFGISEPSADWDLNLNPYQSTFSFDTQIYSNYNFKNHGGTMKVDVSATFSEDIPDYLQDEYYYDVELWSTGLFGGKETYSRLEFGTAWEVIFSNLSSGKKYFLVFSQPYNHRHGVVEGDFKVYK